MQVLVEMASSPESLQPPLETVAKDEDKTFLAPPPPAQVVSAAEQQAPRVPRNGFQGKRRNSFNVGFKHPMPFKRRRRVNSDCDPVLPSNFLLGGNIFDPLNLNSLLDEDVNRTLNAETPKSSPLPPRNRDPVEILIPKDMSDPLSLNTGSSDVELLLSPLKSGRKRHRHRHHPSTDVPPKGLSQEPEPTPEELRPYELNTAINCRDEVVPLPSLDNEASDGSAAPAGGTCTSGSRHRKRRRTSSKSEGRQGSPEKARTLASVITTAKPPSSMAVAFKPSCPGGKERSRFQYGNYCRYYGYRNPCRSDDPRLSVLRPEWFRGKAVLDIGCNVGHLTLCVAQNLGPSLIVGLDIDGSLIRAARQNIRHYLSESAKGGSGSFPAALAAMRGPIAAPVLPAEVGKERKEESRVFPDNVMFVKGNYVVDRDELAEVQRPEYDVILCFSITKWVHLNWGDEGLKRTFRRIYRHLSPGGILVLEPQPWSSYGKRKKLTETIYKNYCRISLKPDQFTSYLMSSEVGFSSYELLAAPCASSKGFQRPIYAFHKSGPRVEIPPPPSPRAAPPPAQA